MRFLPNPHFVPRLRPFTGKDPRVARYIRSFPQTGEFLRRIESLLGYLIPHYIREGKSYLTIALGCTGRAASLGGAGGSDPALAAARGLRDKSRASRPGQVTGLAPARLRPRTRAAITPCKTRTRLLRLVELGKRPAELPEMTEHIPQLTERDEIRRLLRYLRPYTPLLALGILLIAVMGVAELIVALAIKPALDVILNPHSTVQKLALFTIPGTQYVVNLNAFVPHRIHHVWSVFAVSLLFLFFIKGRGRVFRQHVDSIRGLGRHHRSAQHRSTRRSCSSRSASSSTTPSAA